MVIGLTGKSCSGKNEAGNILGQAGLEVWDLDRIAHRGLEENREAVAAVFGPGASRASIGKVVFSDPEKRKQLEDILYPWLGKKISAWKDANPDGVLVINGALLHRAGFHLMCDAVIYVDAPFDVRLKRALGRDGVTEEQFRLREGSQDDVDYRVVDYVVPLHVISNGDLNLDELRRQVLNICDKIGVLTVPAQA
jgi:dephospho-CoA kinase